MFINYIEFGIKGLFLDDTILCRKITLAHCVAPLQDDLPVMMLHIEVMHLGAKNTNYALGKAPLGESVMMEKDVWVLQ